MFAPCESCGDAQEISWNANARERGRSLPAAGLEAERYAAPKRHPGAARGFLGRKDDLRRRSPAANRPQARSVEPLAGVIVIARSTRTQRAKRHVGASASSSWGRRTCCAFRWTTAPTSPAVKTCSISAPKPGIRGDQWGASTTARRNSSASCFSRSLQCWAMERTTAGIRVMAEDRQRMPPAPIKKIDVQHGRRPCQIGSRLNEKLTIPGQ
jgi:hypothetical protein